MKKKKRAENVRTNFHFFQFSACFIATDLAIVDIVDGCGNALIRF